MPPNPHFPLRRRRRLIHHTVKHWYGLHSLLLPFIMERKYMLAQSDSLNAVLWDAARAVGVGLVFVWTMTPAPVQVLSIIMTFHLSVVVRVVWLHKPNAPELGVEIWRMFYTLIALLIFRMLIQMTGSSVEPVLFVTGVFGWWEAVLTLRDMIVTGTKFPPIIEQFVMAMFKIQSKKLARWVKMLDDEEKKTEPAE